MTSTPLPAGTERRSLAFVFALVVIDMIGFGIIMPVLPALIVELTGASVEDAARDAGWLMFCYAVMQFLFGPVIGGLSDRFGRRPVLIASLAAFAINYALMAFAPSLAWLFAGRIVAGIAGASFSSAYAYVADITPPERRAQNFGLMGMAFGLGFIVGPALGGVLGEVGTRLPFFAAAGLAFANAAYGLAFLKESLPRDRRRAFSLKRSSTLGALKALAADRPALLWLAGAALLWQTGHQSFPAVWSFFAIERLGWSAGDIGLSLAAVGVSSALVQGGLIRIVVPRIGEPRAAVIGMVAMIVAFAMYGFAASGAAVYAAIAVGSIAGLAYPSLNGIMSKHVAADAQGSLQGLVASLTSLGAIVGPPAFTQVFAYFSGEAAPFYLPGAPFVLAGALSALALLLFVVGARNLGLSVSRTA